MVFRILKRVQAIVKQGFYAVSTAISHLTKPITNGPALGTLADLARSKPQLLAENLLLREQLVVLSRSISRPRFTPVDRGIFVLLTSKLLNWKDALLIVKPETVLAGTEKAIACSGSGNLMPRRGNRRFQTKRAC
jgi:putative transposase